MREAQEKLEAKGYYVSNQFDGFTGTLPDEYEIYHNDEVVIDHLSENQVIALANIL